MSPRPSSRGTDTGDGQRHRGPSLLLLSVVFAGLFIGSLVVVAAMSGGGHFPSPFEPVAATNAFLAENRDAIRLGAFLQFGASVPLAIFAATASSRLRFLGIEAAGVAVTGGLSRKLPRWVMWSGLFVASVAELSSLSIALAPASYLLPIARFTGLVWLIVVGALLPSTRASAVPRQPSEPNLSKALEGAENA